MARIGVLALQGAFEEHGRALNKLGIESFEIRQKKDLTARTMDGIILPGGESTVIGKLLRELELFDPLQQMIQEGLPVMGTCAGLILLAKSISGDEHQYLATMDITARRNAYGRQLGSFRRTEEFDGIGPVEMTFIRAPLIEKVSEKAGAEILARVDGNIVAAKQRNMLVTAFHPELTNDLRVHQYFLKLAAVG